jgi:hypothetical protein
MSVAFASVVLVGGKRVVLDYRDPVINPLATSRLWFLDKILTWMERFILKRAASVTVAASRISPLLSLPRESTVTVLSGYDPEEAPDLSGKPGISSNSVFLTTVLAARPERLTHSVWWNVL